MLGIEWASVLEWGKTFEGEQCDNDNPEHIQWIYQTALKRALIYDIKGVTVSLTQGISTLFVDQLPIPITRCGQEYHTCDCIHKCDHCWYNSYSI